MAFKERELSFAFEEHYFPGGEAADEGKAADLEDVFGAILGPRRGPRDLTSASGFE